MSSFAIRSTRSLPPAIEALESRIAPAAWTVTTLADTVGADGFLSLREAIQASQTNAAVFEAAAGSPDGDVITFDPSLFGTIELGSPLSFVDDVRIDGAVSGGRITIDFSAVSDSAFLIDTSLTSFAGNRTVAFHHLDFTTSSTHSAAPFHITSSVGHLTEVALQDIEVTNSTAQGQGGVFFVHQSKLRISDSSFDGNQVITSGRGGVRGGVIYGIGSSVTIEHSTFTDNVALSGSGGAIYLGGDSSLLLRHVDFDSNVASVGGAISLDYSSLTYAGGTMSRNQADEDGGAIAISADYEDPSTVSFVRFSENTALSDGGAIYLYGAGAIGYLVRLSISGGSFSENTATMGGAIFAENSMLNVTGAEFVGNEADGGSGGALALVLSDTTIQRSTFAENAASIYGGGIHTVLGNALVINQSTFSENTAGDGGGNLQFMGNDVVTISNSTIVGGSAPSWPNIGALTQTLTIRSSLLAGTANDLVSLGAGAQVFDSLIETLIPGALSGSSSGNLLNVDPLLGAFDYHGGFTRTYDLQAASPAIDAGSNPNNYDHDQRGTPFKRVEGAAIDIGAFEAPPAPQVTLLSGGKVAQFRDVDGDLVSISTSRGAFSQSHFFLVPEGLGARLITFDISHDPAFTGANLAFKAARTARGGDGLVNVYTFDATGVSLGNVLINGDLGQFYAGASAGTVGVTSLNVLSIGEYGYYGDVEVLGKLGSFTVRTDLQGIELAASELGPVKVNGSIFGSRITVDRGITSLSVGGNIIEADLKSAGLGILKVNGSILGADIDVAGSISNVLVTGNLIDVDLFAEGGIGIIAPGATIGKYRYVGGITIKGGYLGGDVGVGGDLANFRVSGDVQHVLISVQGDQAAADVFAAQTIGNFTVGGRFSFSDLLVGYDFDLKLVSSDVQVASVAVNGSWSGSNLAVGVARGADGFLGTADDEILAEGLPFLVSRIGSLVIKGAAYGTSGIGGDYYGIAAEEIAVAKIGLTSLALTPGAHNDVSPILYGVSFDFALHEVNSVASL